MKRTPWLAELLNLFPFPMGLGYLYLGKKRNFVLTLLVATPTLVGLLWSFVAARNYKGDWSAPYDFNEAGAYGMALLVLVVLPLAIGTALHAYFLAGGTARAFLPQQSKLVLALILAGFPLALGALLVNPTGLWVNSRTGASAWAFALGIGFLLVLGGALLATWKKGGLGHLAVGWCSLWVVAGLGVGVLLILLGLDDAMTPAFVSQDIWLVFLGGAAIAVLALGFVGPTASTAISKRLRRL